MTIPVGGVLPDVSGEINAAALLSQLSAMSTLSDLYELVNVLGRMETNVEAIGASGYFVTQAGGDLYRLARDAYGDASEWATIARVNGLTDPQLDGVTTVLVPPLSGNTEGVLTDVLSPTDAGLPFIDSSRVALGAFDFLELDDAIMTTLI